MRRGRVLAVVVTAVGVLGMAGVLGTASPADAGAALVNARIGAQEDGPYEDVTLGAKLSPGKARSFHVKVKNASDDELRVTLTALLNGTDAFKEKYYRNDREITEQVDGAGFEFGLQPGQTKRFRLRVKAIDVPEARCISSNFDPGEQAPDNADAVFLELNGVCA